MADLEIKIIGDGKSAQDTFKKLSQNVQEATGYIGKMEAEMKLLKAQMRSASESDIPAMRTQFLGLKTAIREAQYGTESFTKKIGGEFDAAISKAQKKLFDLGNVLKASVGFLGVAGLVGSFVQATGAADVLEQSIQKVVKGLKDLGKTNAEIHLQDVSIPLLERASKYLESQVPIGIQIAGEIEKLQRLLDVSKSTKYSQADIQAGPLSGFINFFKTNETAEGSILTADEGKIRSTIKLLQDFKAEIDGLNKSAGGAASATENLYEKISPSDFLKDFVNLPDLTFQRHKTDMLLNQLDVGALPGSGFGLQDRLAIQNNKEWIKRYFEDAEEAIKYQERLQEQADQKRLQMMDRAGARIAQTFEDAVSAGMRGGFDEFLRNYMQQVGLKTFSGLLRLAFSSATGGSFGAGNLLGHIFGFAGGGEFYTHGAMPIIVGDNPGGIEKVTVEPISGRGTTGLKNGHLALAGGGSVMSAPSFHNQGGGGNIELTLEVDKVNLGKVLYMPNGVVDTINRMRANPA